MIHNKVKIGDCIRDEDGQFVLPRMRWFSPIINVDAIEVLSLLSTLKWVHYLNLNEVDPII